MEKEEGDAACLLLLRAAWAAALASALYLGFVRRATGASGTAFHRREPGRGREAGERPPADAWSPRLSGFSLRLAVHLANTAFGQLILVPLLMRINNFTILRYLDIPEDPTFLPVVVDKGKSDHSKSSSVLETLHKLIDISSRPASSTFNFKGIQDYLNCYRATSEAENHQKAVRRSETRPCLCLQYLEARHPAHGQISTWRGKKNWYWSLLQLLPETQALLYVRPDPECWRPYYGLWQA